MRKRCDSRQAAFDCYLFPRRHTDLSSAGTLREVRLIWEATVANKGIPPLCMAHDNHILRVQLTDLFLGLRPLPALPFLDKCTKAGPTHHVSPPSFGLCLVGMTRDTLKRMWLGP